ncbi:MAG: sialidase family protein [Kofleriaceae bacterium]
MQTPRQGPLCLATCSADSDCRADEGYVCERGACTLPNLAIPEPQIACGGAKQDVAFKNEELLGPGQQPSAVAAKPYIAMWETSAGIASNLVSVRANGGTTTNTAATDIAATNIATTNSSTANPAATNGATTTNTATTNTASANAASTTPTPFASIGHDVVVARDATTIYATWRDSESIQLTSSSDDGASWKQPHAVQADDGSELGRPFLAAGKKSLFLLYGDGDHGLRVRVSHDHGATFGPGTTALAGAYGNAVVDDTGALHIVTINGTSLGGYGSAMQTIEYAVSRDDGATFTTRVIATGERLPYYFANPAIAIDNVRKWIYIAFPRGGRDVQWDLLVAASHDAGKTWTRRAIGDGCAIHLVPNLALDGKTGTLHLAYYSTNGGPRFTHATCEIGAAHCTEWGAINAQPFGAFTLLSRHAPWLGDHEALFIDSTRTLHAFWTQPSGVFHATAKLR